MIRLPEEIRRSSTHYEYSGEGYSVRIQHCEEPGCDLYLGVNYPSRYCADHQPTQILPRRGEALDHEPRARGTASDLVALQGVAPSPQCDSGHLRLHGERS